MARPGRQQGRDTSSRRIPTGSYERPSRQTEQERYEAGLAAGYRRALSDLEPRVADLGQAFIPSDRDANPRVRLDEVYEVIGKLKKELS